MIERICKNCRFVKLDKPDNECRKKSPIAIKDGKVIITCWPFVNDDDFCGEFEEKE